MQNGLLEAARAFARLGALVEAPSGIGAGIAFKKRLTLIELMDRSFSFIAQAVVKQAKLFKRVGQKAA